MTTAALANLRESRARASQGDVTGAIAAACAALDELEQGSALETEIVGWLEELERKNAAPTPPPDIATSPDDASASDTKGDDGTGRGDNEATLATSRPDRLDAPDSSTLATAGVAAAQAESEGAEVSPAAAASSGGQGGPQSDLPAATATTEVPKTAEDDELLAAVRAYRRELDVGAQEQVAASSDSDPRTHPGHEGPGGEHDFEDGEQRDEADEGSVVERLLKSRYTTAGAAALMLVVVWVTAWWLFFSDTETRPKTSSSVATAQTGWPDLTYKERRRGLVSPDEASIALKRAYDATRREMNAPDEERLQPGGLTKDDVESVSELSQVPRGTPDIEQERGLGASVASDGLPQADQRVIEGASDTTAPPSGKPRGRRDGKTGRKPTTATTAAQPPRGDETARPHRGRWFFGTGAAETNKDKPTAAAKAQLKRAPIPIATQIKARLEMGVSSLSHGQVMARLVRSVTAGKFTLPQGALLIGRSSHRSARVFLSFVRVIHGGESWSLVGEAVAEDKMKGIPARKRTVTLEERQQAAVARGALGALRQGVVARTGTVGQLVDEAAGGAVEEVREDQQVDESVVYEVAAGEEFTLVVTE